MKINKVNQTSFEGLNKVKKIEPNFEEQIKAMVEKLLTRAEREVSEYGDFKPVFEIVENKNKNLSATDFILKIRKTAGEDPKMRSVDAIAYQMPSPLKYEHTVLKGSKKELMAMLENPEILAKVKETFERLSSHFA